MEYAVVGIISAFCLGITGIAVRQNNKIGGIERHIASRVVSKELCDERVKRIEQSVERTEKSIEKIFNLLEKR